LSSENKNELLLNKKKDYHIHTNYNDHSSKDLTVRNVINHAEEIGLETIAITEHIRKSSSDWIQKYLNEIEIHSGNSKVRIIPGFEGKILPDGSIDCPKKYAENFFLIASFHTKFDEKLTWFNALIKAIENPDVNVIGHIAPEPTFTMESEEISEIAHTIAENDKIVELNAKYRRPPLEWISIFRNNGVKFHLASDAHALVDIGRFENISDLINLAQKPIEC